MPPVALLLLRKGVQLPLRSQPDFVRYRHMKCFRSQSGQIRVIGYKLSLRMLCRTEVLKGCENT